MNIVWEKPDGALAVTHVYGDALAEDHAQQLIDSGAIPADWLPVRFDVELPNASVDLLTLDDSGEIVIDEARLAEIDRTEYRRQRAAAYPSIVEQLDLIYHGGLDVWRAEIDSVKTRYPKPAEN